MKLPAVLQRQSVQLVGGTAMLIVSLLLIMRHAQLIHAVNGDALPVAAKIPPLEQRLELLRQQIELSEVNGAMQNDSPEERLRMFVLPESTDLPRLLSFFEILKNTLEHNGSIRRMSDIEVLPGDHPSSIEGLAAHPMTLQLAATQEGFQTLSRAIALSGLLTVADALTADEMKILLQETEKENPAGLIALEQFLGLDLLAYARDAKAYDDRLLKSYSSESFASLFAHLKETSLLHDATAVLGGEIGAALQTTRAWPLPFLTLEGADITHQQDGWMNLMLTLQSYTRKKAD